MHREVCVREHHGVKAYGKYGGKAPHILDLEPLRRCVSFIALPYPLDRNHGVTLSIRVEWNMMHIISFLVRSEMRRGLNSVINMRYPLKPNGNYTCHQV